MNYDKFTEKSREALGEAQQMAAKMNGVAEADGWSGLLHVEPHERRFEVFESRDQR